MGILVVFAHPKEAAPSINALKARPIGNGLYAFDGGQIVVSGMGCIAAATVTAQHGRDAEEIWNLGLAGSLKDDLNVGTLVEIASVARPEEGVPLTLGESGHRLVSCDHGVQSEPLRSQLARAADLVDMEGYGVAHAAKDKRCKLWKIVSDMAGPGASQAIANRLPELSRELADHLERQLRYSLTPTSP